MSITGAIVLFSMIWFICLFVALQVGQRTQGDAGEVVPGTPASAPANLNLKRKVILVSVVTLLLWAPLCALILSGWIGIDDIDLFTRFGGGLSR